MSDIKRFAGFGASENDLERGYIEPKLPLTPSYDASNYWKHWSDNKGDMKYFDITREEMEFQDKDMVSKGFLNRLVLPTER